MSLLWKREIGVKLLYAAGGHDDHRRFDYSQNRTTWTFEG